MKQETALHWFANQLEKLEIYVDLNIMQSIAEITKEAIELEKNQIEMAFWEGAQSVYVEDNNKCLLDNCQRNWSLIRPMCSYDPYFNDEITGADEQYYLDNYCNQNTETL